MSKELQSHQAAPLKIRLYGDPILRRKSHPVKTVGPQERQLIRAMIEAMHQSKGVGLAAPQVGINKQILVVDIGLGPVAVVNPQIVKKSGSEKMEEGCLSIPGIAVNVKRPQKILLRYLNENNEILELEYSDLLARVILHEIDHLKGKLIIDYLPLTQRFKIRDKLKAIRLR
jgi:peptide deformylase